MLKKNILLFIQSSFYLHYQKAKFVKLFFIHLSMTMINHNDYFYHKEPKFFWHSVFITQSSIHSLYLTILQFFSQTSKE